MSREDLRKLHEQIVKQGLADLAKFKKEHKTISAEQQIESRKLQLEINRRNKTFRDRDPDF